MVTVKEALKLTAEALKSVTEEADLEAKIILSSLLETEPSRLNLIDKKVSQKELSKIINRRKKGEPLQYILGKWWFYEGEFFVGKGVLVPRQDTETLVDTALEKLQAKNNLSIADLCAGSGAIAISVAAKLPDSTVTAVEKYKKAFSFLKKNILHNKTPNVKAVKADVLKKPFGLYDMILSNPPYVTRDEMKGLSREVKREPKTALLGGNDGLLFYRAISKNWKASLKKGGILMFEIGATQAESVAEILKNEGFEHIEVVKDFGGNQRVVFGTLNQI